MPEAGDPTVSAIRQADASWRAIALGLFLVVLAAPAAFFTEIRYATTYMFGSGVPAMAPLALLMLLTVLNPALDRLRLRAFSRRELLSVYAIVLVGAPLVTHGILAWMLSSTVTLYYGAYTTSPQWAALLPLVPTWFSPSNPPAVASYFVGGSAVPWPVWLRPAAAWGSFMAALFIATVCLGMLLRRQWITHERLSFPFAQVPLQLVREEQDSVTERRSASRNLLIGLAVGFGIMAQTRLPQFFPSLPSIPLTGQTIVQWQSSGPLSGLGAWEIWVPPGLIAIAYLVPKDLSFSCWFFWLVRLGLTVGAVAAGGTPQRPEEWTGSSFPAPTYQGGGAVLAISIWIVWIGRRHLSRAIRSAFGSANGPESSSEPFSYRLTLIVLALSTCYLVGFYMMAGTRFSIGLTIVVLIIIYYIVWTRLRAETGLGFIPFPLLVNSMVVAPFGAGVLLPREAIVLLLTRWSYYPGYGESFEVCTGSSLEALKIADSAGISARRLLVAMVAGLLLSVTAGTYVVLVGEYHYGFVDTPGAWAGWVRAMLQRNGSQALEYITDPKGPDVNGMLGIGAGAAATLVLGFLRARFWWWPLHPVGYLAANCWGMHWFSQSFFVGWALKSVVTKYGGLSLYRRTVPLATGVILGDVASQACWVTVMSVAAVAGATL